MNFRGGFPIPRPEFQFEGCLMPVTPEKPPTLARSNSVLENPQGNHQGTENLAQQTPNYSFSAPVFNTSSQAPSIPGWLALAGNLAERNPVIMNHIPGSYQQQPLPSDGAARNNLPLTQLLLQRGANFTASPNSALSRYMRMAAKRPLMPSQQPQTSNLRGDCSLGGFSSGSSFRPEYANVHCQVVNSRTVGSNSVNLLCREQNHCLTSEQLDNGNSLPQILQYKCSVIALTVLSVPSEFIE